MAVYIRELPFLTRGVRHLYLTNAGGPEGQDAGIWVFVKCVTCGSERCPDFPSLLRTAESLGKITKFLGLALASYLMQRFGVSGTCPSPPPPSQRSCVRTSQVLIDVKGVLEDMRAT